MLTYTEENYLKAIYSTGLHNKNGASTNSIAKKLATKASSVTDMFQKLADKNLITYKKYKGAKLTSKGKNIAVSIIRKHRLWEVFLVEKLNYNWDEVHELAEQLEHIKSNNLIDKLEAFLNYPTFDPHGDPIPNKNGEIEHHKNVMLSSLSENSTGKVVGIKNSSNSFLQYLDQLKIALGSVITVNSIVAFDNTINISVNGKLISVSNQVAQNLFIQKI